MGTISLSLFSTLKFSPHSALTRPILSTSLQFPFKFRRQWHNRSELGNHFRLSSQPSRNHVSREEESEGTIEDLRVPHQWLEPSKALEESEWLRVTLHKLLDDEYCPEPTNVKISKVAADSYHRCLLENTTDLGEILLKMVTELQTISYKESFHGAFSSANAAVSLIAQRIEEIG